MLTDRNELVDEVMVINAGADDYVAKPIDVNILSSRISQQLKRGQSKLMQIEQNLVWGPMEMDLNQHTFTIENNSVKLTNSEFQFLQLLMENPQRIFSRHEILGALGVSKGIGTNHIVDAHASRIRSKIRENGGPEVISVIRSVGFRLTDQQLLGV
jgi:two-component system catabolic regulation response regulator CreB